MPVLAIDTSAKAVSVALTEQGRLLSQFYQNNGLTHSRTLAPMVEAVMQGCGLEPESLDYIAVSKGPGSFTGLRIGMAAVKGLAWAWEKPCRGVSTLEAMAFNMAHMEGIVCAAMDARRNQVYNAIFAVNGGGRPQRLTPDRAISVAQLSLELAEFEKIKFLVGDGAELCYNSLDKDDRLRLAPEQLRYQSAWGVACASEFAPQVSAQELAPEYLRLSQAERERIEKGLSIT